MTLLDDRGRLFGKVNLIDAAVVLLVLLLGPLGYSAYVLFRAPVPVISGVTPTTVTGRKGEMIDIKGEHLRPFLRAYLGTTVVEYLFASPDRARLTLPELPAGAYDLILYDEAKEVAPRRLYHRHADRAAAADHAAAAARAGQSCFSVDRSHRARHLHATRPIPVGDAPSWGEDGRDR